MLRLLLDYAFNGLGLEEIAAAVDSPNSASIRLVEGFRSGLLSEVAGPWSPLRTYLLPGEVCRRRGSSAF